MDRGRGLHAHVINTMIPRNEKTMNILYGSVAVLRCQFTAILARELHCTHEKNIKSSR
jgi:hypothetical protein